MLRYIEEVFKKNVPTSPLRRESEFSGFRKGPHRKCSLRSKWEGAVTYFSEGDNVFTMFAGKGTQKKAM